LNVTPSGSDSDAGQTLTYTLSTGPANATIDPNTGVIHWTPTALQAPSTNHFKVKVTDNGVGTLSASITFTVVVIAPSNHAPSLAAIVDKTVYLGRTLSFTASATDPDGGQTLSYSLNAGFPTGASIDATSGLFQWTPSPAQAPGTNQITVTVTDNGLPILTDSKSFNAIVALPPKLGATRSGNTISLSFPSVPGKHYTVQFKNDLNSNSWTDLVTNQAATDTTTTVPDTIVTTPDGRGQRFYRITVLD
jgi:hypothetical protein